jgi:acyl-CoA synthetase (AMP-forming)/AMP-acid ligase II
VWKPVVCAVHGMCTAGAFYFVNESDIVICSDDATFFDSHVTYGFVSALEPVGLMRKVGLGEALRIALSGNDERVTAETALRIGLVTEVVPRAALWGRAHEIAQGIACKPRAATEGGVAGWNLADHERFWAAKRGSVGRAHPGCELRVVDARSGAPLAPDDEGLLEVKTLQLGDDPEWVRTTDVARIDTDGFVYILGRADQAIIRGGFKVRPEDVRAALERDPRVRGAAVVSRPDARLGAVPVAAVELRPGSGPVPEGELLTEAAKVLARYELPDELRLVEALPRTPAGKVDLAAVRELFTTEPA